MSEEGMRSTLGELLATVASEASEHPFIGSEAQKEAWDEIKWRFDEIEDVARAAISWAPPGSAQTLRSRLDQAVGCV